MRTCKRCQVEKPIEEFYRQKGMADGRLSFCRECVTARVRAHREANDHVREQERMRYRSGSKKKTDMAWALRNRGRSYLSRVASVKVSRAVQRGEIKRSGVCEECGRDALTEAAHYDYSRPLDVRWLCRRCHRKWDAREPKTLSAVAS